MVNALVALNQVSKLGLLSLVCMIDNISCHNSEVWLSKTVTPLNLPNVARAMCGIVERK